MGYHGLYKDYATNDLDELVKRDQCLNTRDLPNKKYRNYVFTINLGIEVHVSYFSLTTKP